jgi:tricarballylate dehydrogenase
VHEGAAEVRRFLPEIEETLFARLHLPPYRREDFHADLARVTQGRIDPVLADRLVATSNEAVHWMREIGIRWETEKTVEVEGKLYFEPGIYLHPIGGGLGLLLRLREIALARGVEIRYGAAVRALLGSRRGIEGVLVSTATGEYAVRAPSLILCSGGFQANIEMRARYLGRNADLVKVRGSRHNTGEVLQMALALGARPAGHWQGAHMTPIDKGAPDLETPLRQDGRGNSMNRYDYTFGITVNALGQRFYDEGENKHSLTYAKTGRAVLAQPGGIAFQLYDATGMALFRHGRDFPATMEEAGSIAALAGKIGIEPAVLSDSVARFNRACRADVGFDPRRLDGKSTIGLDPPKSNWAVPLETPPFRAYPVTAGITFTFGGVAVDTEARVLDLSGEPIPGLFASGDVVGLFFHNYPSCTGQTRNAVFSMLAGRNAAAHAAR